MDVGLYIAAQGMLAEQVRQDQLTNDLANASTPGYKSDHSVQTSFDDLLLSNTSTGQPIGPLATGVTISKVVTDMTPAPLQQTGQPLDFAVDGTGFFAVSTPQGVRYTRDGQFSANAQGLLIDARGQPGARPERRTDPGQREGHRPRERARRVQRPERAQAGQQPVHAAPPPGARPAPSSRASSRAPASTRSTRWST